MANRKQLIKRVILLSCALAAVIALVFGWALFEFVRPTNAADNANPARRAEMLKITLHAADLAPIPSGATNVSIKTEGNSFTRSFRVEFTAPPAAVKRWLAASTGIARARTEKDGPATKYIITHPNDGYGYAEVTVDGAGVVKIYVAWS